jgi:hypothetical protein
MGRGGGDGENNISCFSLSRRSPHSLILSIFMTAPVKGIIYKITRDKKQHTQENYGEFLFVNNKKI